MDFQRLLSVLTLSLFPALMQASQQPASNSNARPPESYAIGERATPVLAHHQESFGALPEALKLMAYEYLTHEDYARIRQLSKAERGFMHNALYIKHWPLVLPEGNKLVALTKNLIKNASDLHRLSAVKALFSICERSHHGQQMALDAALLYMSQVPEAERLWQVKYSADGNAVSLTTNAQLLKYIAQAHAQLIEIEAQRADHRALLNEKKMALDDKMEQLNAGYAAKKEQWETYRGYLQTWQPYGLLFRLSFGQPNIQAIDKELGTPLGQPNFNFFQAPEICDIHPCADAVPESVIAASNKFNFPTPMEMHRLRHLRKQIAQTPKSIDITNIKDAEKKLTQCLTDFVMRETNEAIQRIQRGESEAIVHSPLQHLDEITRHTFCIWELVLNKVPIQDIVTCLNTVLDPLLRKGLETRHWAWNILNARNALQCLAAKTNDEWAKKALSTQAQMLNRENWKLGSKVIVLEMSPIWLLTIGIEYCAWQYDTDHKGAFTVGAYITAFAALALSIMLHWGIQ